MQRNQWKIAGEQLLSHWKRSGITQVPIGMPQGIATATAWLEQNSDVVFEEDDFIAKSDAPTVLRDSIDAPKPPLSPSVRPLKDSPPVPFPLVMSPLNIKLREYYCEVNSL